MAAKSALRKQRTADDWVGLALAARGRDDHAGAEEAFRHALALVPDHPLLPVDIAYALFELGRDEEASALLESHLAQFPQNIHAHVALGHHARRNGRLDAALACFQRAQQLEPSNPILPIDVALLQVSLGCPADACATLQDALALHPHALPLNRELARLALTESRHDLALAPLRTLMQLEPEEVSHPLALAGLLLDAGQQEEAETMIGLARRILQVGSGCPQGRGIDWHRLGQLERRQGRLAEADAAYAAGIEAEPSAIECHLALFWQAMDAPDPDQAERILSAAEAAGAPAVRVSMLRVHLLRARGKLDEALEGARNTLTGQPDDSEAIAVTAELLWQQGHYDQSQNVLNTLPVDSPFTRGARARHHARLALARFELQSAQDLVGEAIQCLGADPELLNLKSRIALMRGAGQEALASLRERSALLQRAGLPASHPEAQGGFNLHLVREYGGNIYAAKALRESQDRLPVERVGAIAQILRTEPTHFGAAHQLLISLRQGGAFADREPPGGRSNHPTSPVPRKIVQFWDQPEIPGDILLGMLSWPQQCLGFEHQIFNDASAHAFIQRTCDKTVAKAYRQANHPAMRADIFRLAYLAVEGGIYADADDICRRSVGDLLSPNVELVLVQEDLGSIGNNFICVRPEHPFIAAALEQVVTQVLKKQQNIIWFLTGPGAMTQRFCLYFLDVLAAGELPQEVQILDFYALQQHLSMHLPRAYKRGALHWTSPDAAPIPLFMPG